MKIASIFVLILLGFSLQVAAQTAGAGSGVNTALEMLQNRSQEAIVALNDVTLLLESGASDSLIGINQVQRMFAQVEAPEDLDTARENISQGYENALQGITLAAQHVHMPLQVAIAKLQSAANAVASNAPKAAERLEEAALELNQAGSSANEGLDMAKMQIQAAAVRVVERLQNVQNMVMQKNETAGQHIGDVIARVQDHFNTTLQQLDAVQNLIAGDVTQGVHQLASVKENIVGKQPQGVSQPPVVNESFPIIPAEAKDNMQQGLDRVETGASRIPVK